MAHRTLADDRLVVLAQAGDRSAFDQLAERHSTRLRRVLFRITRDCDAAYDAVQEALMRAWRNIGRFEGRSQFSTWLTRIGINEAHRGHPRASEQPLELSDEVGERIPSWGARPDEVFESREFLAAVDRALGQRALKSRVHRGRMALRAKLDDYFAEGYA